MLQRRQERQPSKETRKQDIQGILNGFAGMTITPSQSSGFRNH